MVEDSGKSKFYWRWFGALPKGRRNRIVDNLRSGKIDIVIAEACPGEPSSIIDLTGDEPVLIRRGLGDLSWLE